MVQTNVPEWNPSHSRLKSLDGLRGIAILLVIYWHYYGYAVAVDAERNPLLRAFSGLSWSGVDLFFVLSGYLIGSILISKRGAKHYFSAFYIRRACRIFPLYYLMVGIYLLVRSTGVVDGSELSPLAYGGELPVVGYLTHTQNYFMIYHQSIGPKLLDVTWSLAIEEQFYLLLAPLIRFVENKKVMLICLACIVAAPLFRVLCIQVFESSWIWVFASMPSRMDAMFFGVLIALILRRGNTPRIISERIAYVHAAFIALLVVAFFIGWQTSFQPLRSVSVVALFSILSFTYASLLLLALLSSNSLLQKILSLPFLRFMGRISYCAYLIHNPIMWIAHSVLLNQQPKLTNASDFAATTLALLATCALAWMSYHLLEKHFIRLGHSKKYESLSAS